MSRDPIRTRFDQLNVWSRGSERAPHKPLLVLYALGKWSRGEPHETSFSELGPELTRLLVEFGPARQAYHPEYPFWRLQNDGIWRVNSPVPLLRRKGQTDPRKSELLKHNVQGGFSDEVLAALDADPDLASDLASQLLEGHFPESIHNDILGAVGLSLERSTRLRRKRDPRFRERVLTAYEYCCAVCGFDVKIGRNLLALDAAHIKWHQAGGPDEERNGLALCVMHHKTFDLGAFTVRRDLAFLVSDQVHGSTGVTEILGRFHGEPIRKPQRPEHLPDQKFLDWHAREVFKGAPRHL